MRGILYTYGKNYTKILQQNKKYFILYGIFSLFLALSTTFFSFIEREEVFVWWLMHPAIILCNALPLFLLMVFLHACARKYPVPLVVAAILIFSLCVGNREKILYRQDPLFFDDLILWREAVKILLQGSFSKTRYLIMAAGAGAIIGFLILTPWGRYSLKGKERILLGGSAAIAFFISLPLLYSGYSPAAALIPPRSAEEVNIAQTFRDQGIVYSLLRYREVNHIQKPTPFLAKEVQNRINQFQTQTLQQRPDVIMIMGEAWSDVSENKNLHFYPGMDPFAQVRSIMDSSLGQGHIIAPTFGGGTANTEYDALTGNATLYLSDSRFTSYQATRRNIDSIVSALMNQGYRSYALHPGYKWFYNRENVYAYLGFGQREFFEDFEYPLLKGKFISEEQTMERFETRLEELVEKKAPYFAFLVTIQNHSPYNSEKYGSLEDTFTCDLPLTKESKEMLEAYFVGIRDMNTQIVKLVNRLQNSPRPTLLCYWGDHQPFLGPQYQAFHELGYHMDQGDLKDRAKIYQTPYFIWGNAAFRQQFSQKSYPPYVNANYIPAMVLQSFDATEIDPFFSFEREMMDILPVFHKYFIIEGNAPEEFQKVHLKQKEKEYLDLFKTWEYLRAK